MSGRLPSMAERAEELARSGNYEFVYQIERQLKSEGYPAVETTFEKERQVRKTLREIIGARRGPKPVTKK